MPVYHYKATSSLGKGLSGTILSDGPKSARDELRSQGLKVVEIKHSQANQSRFYGIYRWFAQRRAKNKFVDIIRELSTLLAVGIPVVEALESVAKNSKYPVQSTILEIKDRIVQGASLADALREHPWLFDELTVQIIDVGEQAGTLDHSLEQLADFKMRSQNFKDQIFTSLLYPAAVLTLGTTVAIFLMTFVVPQLLQSLIEAGRPLPTATLIVKGISDILVNYWWVLLLASATTVSTLIMIIKTPRGRHFFHSFILKIPYVGAIALKQELSRLSIVLHTLLKSGVVLVSAIEIGSRSCKNEAVRLALNNIKDSAMAGTSLKSAMDAQQIFPDLYIKIFSVGEDTGRLEEMLDRVARDFDKDVTIATQRFTALLEPALIILLAIMIGLIAFATVMPILEASNVL